MPEAAATLAMGHRTLVAYDRDGYDLRYAHWPPDPAALAPETPFGGPPDDEVVRGRVADLLEPTGGRLADDRRHAVDPEPLATGLSFEAVCRRIDPLEHEALYVVDADFSVRRYLVVGLRAGGHRRTALVGYDADGDAAYLRGWLAGARAVRAVVGAEKGAVARALRWLDPARGAVVYPVAAGRGV